MPVKDGKNTPSRKVIEPLPGDIYKEEQPSPFSIEGIRSGAVQSKVFKGFIILSGVVMMGGFIMSSLNVSGLAPQQPHGQSVPTQATVATVGNQSVSGIQLANSFQQQMQLNEQYGMRTGVTDYIKAKRQALQGLTDNASTLIAAQQAGITVSDADIDAKIADLIKDKLKPQQGQTEAAFRRQVEAQFGSVDKYKDELAKSYDRTLVSNFLMTDKLQKKIKDENKVTEDDYKRSVTKLKLWQIQLRPKFPAPGAKDVKAETDKNNLEAQTRAAALFATLKKTPTLANFEATARKSSEDLATKTKGGDLGWKMPSEIYYGPDMGDALSKTAGNLAGPFADTSGNQYIFFIESRKTELPKDYAKNKKKLITDYETQQDDSVWQKKQTEYSKAQSPQISDPDMAAYQIQSIDLLSKTGDDQKKARQEAIDRYNEALPTAGTTEAAAINYQLSQLYRDQNERQKQQDALAAAVKGVGTDPALRLEYATALRDGGKPKDAIEQVKAASTALTASPPPPSMFGGNPADQMRQQIAAQFDTLKEPKLAAAERAKIKPAAPGGMGGMPPGIQVSPAH